MKDLDAIVVGAGPAGSSAALRLAQAGLKVVLIDRGSPVGSKNLSGGVLWGNDLAELIPDWQSTAPVERAIISKKLGFLSENDATIVDMHFKDWSNAPHVGMSVLRVKFDEWLSTKAEEAGAILLGGITIDSLIVENERVVGVRQGDEELRAPVVIIAEGVNARLLLKHKMYSDPNKSRYESHEMMAGYKELYHLEQSMLEERFMLNSNEGVAGEFILGNLPNKILAGGFFYTNKNTISIGTVVHLDSLSTEDRAYEVIEHFKNHPYMKKLLKDAELIEYGSKMIPEMGIKGFPKLYGDGWLVVGDAAGFVFTNGLLIQGMNYAIKSGILAADAVIESKSDNKSLSIYQDKLKNSYILKDFKKFSKVKEMTKNPRLFKNYPDAINNAMRNYLTEDGEAKEHLISAIMKSFKQTGVGLFTLMRDGMKARRM